MVGFEFRGGFIGRQKLGGSLGPAGFQQMRSGQNRGARQKPEFLLRVIRANFTGDNQGGVGQPLAVQAWVSRIACLSNPPEGFVVPKSQMGGRQQERRAVSAGEIRPFADINQVQQRRRVAQVALHPQVGGAGQIQGVPGSGRQRPRLQRNDPLRN